MKKLLFSLLFAVFSCLVFVGCGSDDTPFEEGAPSSLVGLSYICLTDYYPVIIEFQADGIVYIESMDVSDYGKYTYSDGHVVFSDVTIISAFGSWHYPDKGEFGKFDRLFVTVKDSWGDVETLEFMEKLIK